MKIPRCDLPAKQQTIAMVDTETGEFTEKTLSHGHEQPQRVRHRILAPPTFPVAPLRSTLRAVLPMASWFVDTEITAHYHR